MWCTRRFSAIAGVLFAAAVLAPGLISAQGYMVPKASNKDTLKTEKKAGDSIILEPVVDPYLYYDPTGQDYRVQSGIFFGRSHFGVETTYRPPGSAEYFNLFVGSVNGRGTGTSTPETFLTGGVSLGREIMLRDLLEEDGMEFYIRVGPGFGLATRGTFDGPDMKYYMGVHTSALMGAQKRISARSSFYLHGGGRVLWFPALNEIGFMSVPVISMGIQFSILPEIPVVRY